MKINIDLVKTGTVVTDVASVFVLVATSNINVYALNVSLHSGRVSINVNIRKNHSTNKSGPAGMNDLGFRRIVHKVVRQIRCGVHWIVYA